MEEDISVTDGVKIPNDSQNLVRKSRIAQKYIHVNMRLQKYEAFRTEIQLVEYDNMMIGIVIIIVAFILSIFNIAGGCCQ